MSLTHMTRSLSTEAARAARRWYVADADGKVLGRFASRVAGDLFEVRNMREVALLISRCAVARQESRGGHYRTDYPDKSAEYQKHSLAASCEEVTFV